MVDLRSDTVTKPTAGMRAAMADAEVGDDVYSEDPLVNSLEERVADLFGHEAAVFVPSGTMGNQIGMRLVCQPGQEVLGDAEAHVVTYEMGAAAAIFGLSTRTVVSTGGVLDADQLIEQVRPFGNWHLTPTAAIAVENTHNRAGGLVQPLAQCGGPPASAQALHAKAQFARSDHRNRQFLGGGVQQSRRQCGRVVAQEVADRVGVEQVGAHRWRPVPSSASQSRVCAGSLRTCARACSKASASSGLTGGRSCSTSARVWRFSRRTTSLPRRKISTDLPWKRKDLGRRTAWLLPDMKMAASVTALSCIYVMCIF